MSLPRDVMESPARPAPLEHTDARQRPKPPLLDREMGGIALNNGQEGLLVREWTVDYVDDDVLIYPSDDPGSAIVALTDSTITGVSLSFDQNMNWAVAYEVPGATKLSWYDASIQARSTLTLTGSRSPLLSMDDKRAFATIGASNDILLFYITGNTVYYRQQRGRFLTERALRTFVGPRINIRTAGLSVGPNRRMVVGISGLDNRVP